ncbi:hypothetical protein BS47DRAFT_562488 [Hydnum rufescens UP504]|uniref:Uncharacterized protein n=1 Tax=Hydnum rufescens UP504 TaxID=1448309 RepID=A0A9P6AGA5_9AGAM|nr:hypothetical protein BS47DRAFT_562488 [Hydnum rufescens UP504]
MENPNHLHIHTGDGGSSENGTSVANGGQGGNVLLLNSNTNNISNVWHIYAHNAGTQLGDIPPSPGIYISLRYGVLEIRFVARLFPFAIIIRHHV